MTNKKKSTTCIFDVSKVQVLGIEGKEMWPSIVKANKDQTDRENVIRAEKHQPPLGYVIELDSIQKLIGSKVFNDSANDDLAMKGKNIFIGKSIEILEDEKEEFRQSVKESLNIFKPWVARSVLESGFVK